MKFSLAVFGGLTVIAEEGLMRDDDGGPPMRPQDGGGVDTTVQGCTCNGKCGATVSQDGAHCDWCYTDNACGNPVILHPGLYWDTCKYPSMDDFESQTHSDKRAQLWSKITHPSVVDKSGPAHDGLKTLKDILTTSMITAFDDQWEVMPVGRTKVIHSQGVMCQFDLAVESTSPFTGVLSPGKQSGLIRFGSASSLDGLHPPKVPTIFPGFGIKFLRSGVRSANWVSLRESGPGGSYNYFSSTFSNHVAPDPALQALGRFQQASGCIDMVGLSDACTYTQAGEKVNKPVFPFEVWFEPTGKANFQDKKKSNADFLGELSGIPDGTEIFSVFAFASPADKKQGNVIPLGTLTSTGTCHQSVFGDLDLFFRHQRMEEDFAMMPEWIPEMEALGDKSCTATTGPISLWQCPHQSAKAEFV